MKRPIIIEIEGTDCSGKETQSKALEILYTKMGYKTKSISLPAYHLKSAGRIKKYLNGEFGDVNEIDPYDVSSYFIANRHEGFIKEWVHILNEYDIIIFDRYVDSNIIYQMPKFEKKEDIDEFITWEYTVEYDLNSIPQPDIKIMLKTDLEVIKDIIRYRKNKIDNSDKKDIHESNFDYMEKTYNACLELAERDSLYHIVECTKNGKFKDKDLITYEIKNHINKYILDNLNN